MKRRSYKKNFKELKSLEAISLIKSEIKAKVIVIFPPSMNRYTRTILEEGKLRLIKANM